jgi:phospholipid/cholesterol/gamma-HCH transport system substrate-binding protein
MKRRDELLVGLLILVAVVVGVFGTIWLVRGGLGGGYPLYARFPWGTGLKVGQPVQLAGVSVGYVADVKLDPNGTLVVEMAIEEEYGIPVGSTATVIAVGIFGDAAIALNPTTPSTQYIAQGDTVPVGVAAPTVTELLARADSIERNVGALTAEIQRQLVDSGGIRDLRLAMAATNDLVGRSHTLIGQLSGIAARQSEELSATLAGLRRSLAAVDSAAVDSTVRNLQATSANVAALTADLRQTSSQLNGVLAQLQGTQGTAGLLLNDPGLYNDLRRLTARIDSLTLDFQKNPRRYINLEIF